jgi:hypothetical protein
VFGQLFATPILTIADMSGRPQVELAHITEALVLRPLDRQQEKQFASTF